MIPEDADLPLLKTLEICREKANLTPIKKGLEKYRSIQQRGVAVKLGIFQKMLLGILVPSVLILLLLTGISFYIAEENMSGLVEEEMSLAVEGQRRELQGLLNMMHATLTKEASLSGLRRMLENYRRNGSNDYHNALVAEILPELKAFQESYPQVTAVAVLAPDGRVLAHDNAPQPDASRADQPYFKTALAGGLGLASLFEKNTGALLRMAVPVYGPGKKVIGVYSVQLSLEELAAISTSQIRLAKTGICMIYDDAGLLLIHPNKSYIGDQDSHLPWMQSILQQKNGVIEYAWNGVEKLAAFRNLPKVGWNVIVTVEKDDILYGINTLLKVCIAASLFAVLLVSAIIFFIARGIARPLGLAADHIQKIGKGQLEFDAAEQRHMEQIACRKDEVGRLAQGIQETTGNLNRMFMDIRQRTTEAEQATQAAREAGNRAEEAARRAESAKREGMLAAAARLESIIGVISTAAEQLSAQVTDSNRRVGETASHLADTATAMNEMSCTTQEVARNASLAVNVSLETRDQALKGAELVRQSQENTQRVQNLALTLKQDMGELNQHAVAITNIMSVISDIADQTNLLALNAAIEAARAGDAGRGFAVVADEVRSLAEKTMASTSEVGNAVNAIQRSMSKSMRAMDEAVTQIAQVAELALSADASLKDIVGDVEKTADEIHAIATASEEQSAASDEINKAIASLSQNADVMARTMDDSAKAVGELARQTQDLSRLVEDLKQTS